MDGNRGKSLLLTKMSPGFDNWRLESQCISTHSKSTQPPHRSAVAAVPEPQIVPEKNSSFVVGERVEPLQQQNQKGNVGVSEVGRSKSNNIREVHSFKFVLIEHIRQILKPFWEQGKLSKDAYKLVMKKSIDKIIASIQASKFPRSKNDHQRYISASSSKIFDLVQAYVKKYQKEPGLLMLQDFILDLSLGSQLYTKMFGLYVEGSRTSLYIRYHEIYTSPNEPGRSFWNLTKGPEASDMGTQRLQGWITD